MISRLANLRYLDARTNRPAIAASSGERELREEEEEDGTRGAGGGEEELRFGEEQVLGC